MFLDIIGGISFHTASDLTNHNYSFRFRVFHQQLNGIQGSCSNNRVSPYSYTGGLPLTSLGNLINSFVPLLFKFLYDIDAFLSEPLLLKFLIVVKYIFPIFKL